MGRRKDIEGKIDSPKERALSVNVLRRTIRYIPETGEFFWLEHRRGLTAGTPAGYAPEKGYRLIVINGQGYMGHRVAWAIVTGSWPTYQIDHRNGCPSDNRWDNLREATSSQQRANSRRTKNAKSPYRGVAFSQDARRKKPWAATLELKGKTVYLGRYETPEEASAAYQAGVKKHFGEFVT